MEAKSRILKAKYIEKIIDNREIFSFANPDQIMRAMDIFSSDCYRLMLHDLGSQLTESIFKAWNTAVILTCHLARVTYTYIVKNPLERNFQSLRIRSDTQGSFNTS
jgi:hypothetical protein